jgi:hypothetical protein
MGVNEDKEDVITVNEYLLNIYNHKVLKTIFMIMNEKE